MPLPYEQAVRRAIRAAEQQPYTQHDRLKSVLAGHVQPDRGEPDHYRLFVADTIDPVQAAVDMPQAVLVEDAEALSAVLDTYMELEHFSEEAREAHRGLFARELVHEKQHNEANRRLGARATFYALRAVVMQRPAGAVRGWQAQALPSRLAVPKLALSATFAYPDWLSDTDKEVVSAAGYDEVYLQYMITSHNKHFPEQPIPSLRQFDGVPEDDILAFGDMFPQKAYRPEHAGAYRQLRLLNDDILSTPIVV